MYREIYNFVGDLDDAVNTPMHIKADFDRIIICGIGGSAIGGDILCDYFMSETDAAITIQRFPELPHWVTSNTFAILCSYSGNTKETLALYKQAVERGCTILIMSSGGILEKMGEERGDQIVKLIAGYQPRSALGMNLGYLAGILDSLCGTNCCGEIRKAIPKLYKLRDELCGEKNIAWNIVKSVGNKAPVIYATSGVYAAAIRWKCQINENAKMMAFAGSVPEFNHNEIAGWSEGELRKHCVPVFLYETGAHKLIRSMANASINALKNYGQDVKVVNIKGRSVAMRVISAIIIGDYVSLYFAYERGINPTEISTIDEFKHRLNTALTNKNVDLPHQ